jgi:trans-aconitate methyltransferase
MRIYSDLTAWYHLIDPRADHLEEAEAYESALRRGVVGRAETLLELGSGAGNNAFYLKRQFRCTLSDVSAAMLDLSRQQNPECEHVQEDMRSLRLDRTFDAVFLHDAIVYMTSERDLLAAATTAFVHTRPGGAALFAPDHVADTFHEATELLEGEDGGRALRGVAWTRDPDPRDTTYTVDYAFLLRDGGQVTAVYDPHVEGLFSEATWHRVLQAAGFTVETVHRPLGGVVTGETDQVFLCRRPEQNE